MNSSANGLLVINKPSGPTSFAVLSMVKKKLGLGKVGFLGTLDPAASGVLVLLIGSYTKRADALHQLSKVYQSRFEFGIETTTLDSEGEVVLKSGVIPTRAEVEAAIAGLVGDIEIEVPKYSAVHIGGRRAYDLAREGAQFVPPKRVVNIKRFELLQQVSEKEFFFEIECETGTYIRSLAKLLANSLGTVAIASRIIRTRVGGFDIADAVCPDEVSLNDIVQISESG